MNNRKPLLTIINGERHQLEQELIKLALSPYPTLKAEFSYLLSLLEPNNVVLEIVPPEKNH